MSSNGSHTRSADSPQEVRRFRKNLKAILDGLRLSWAQLATKADLSPTQLSDLRRVDPSASVLRGVWRALHGKVDERELIRLVMDGITLDDPSGDLEEILGGLPSAFGRSEYRVAENVKTRCIITHTLGERYEKKLLAWTMNQMDEHDTRYFYFLPSAAREKRLLLAFAEEYEPEGETPEKTDPEKEKKRKPVDFFREGGQAYFIQAPGVLFFNRIRIDDVGTATQRACYSVGPTTSPTIIKAEPTEVAAMGHVLYEVVVRVAAGKKSVQICDPSDGMQLSFTVVD